MLHRTTTIDFSRKAPSSLVDFRAHLRVGEVTVARCALGRNDGTVLGSSQLVIALHADDAHELTTGQGSFRETQIIRPGTISIIPANSPVYVEWGGTIENALVVAVEQQMVSRILNNAEMNPGTPMCAKFGVQDDVVGQLVSACSAQVERNDTGGKTFVEGLAIALVTHIYRTYGAQGAQAFAKGGLTPLDAQRVISYIEQNLHEDIGLEQMAAVVKLSTHYFTEAFRKTVGMPPYRFLLSKRIERAKELLLNSDLATVKIAAEVGFSSQAQFITNFRKIVGKTPGRFRREST